MGEEAQNLIQSVTLGQVKKDVPEFRAGDTLRVHTKIIEGSKERIQVFEGVVIKTHSKPKNPSATFTVRKVSYNIGVERTFFLHSPRIEKIEVTRRGSVRRSRLFYLRDRRGKSARIKSKLFGNTPGSEGANRTPLDESPMNAARADSAPEMEAIESQE